VRILYKEEESVWNDVTHLQKQL